MKIVTVVATLLLALAGCSDEQSADKGTTQPTANVPAGPTAPISFRKDAVVTVPDYTAKSVTLTITPNPYSRCDYPKGGAVVSIGYDARPAGVKHAQLWFQNRNGKQNLWGQGPGFAQSAKTGSWIHDGMRVLLVDVSNSDLLAVQTIRADACKQ